MEKTREYGILAPISSLPSSEGIGTLGAGAYKFVDFLNRCGAAIWQILPLNPTSYGDSPYQSCSSNALNYYFIDVKLLESEGLLLPEETAGAYQRGGRRVDYGALFYEKTGLLRKAFSRFLGGAEFGQFLKEGEYYDFAVFMALKKSFGYVSWNEWDEPYRTYNEEVVSRFAAENADEIEFWQFTQYMFLLQWRSLKNYANSLGIKIMGDIPLYIAYDSVEMWKYGDNLFKVDELRRPTAVAGCPPDAFSDDGQLWGNPVYDWAKMKADGYEWWNKRISQAFSLVDILRIDHFRGFDRYYEVPFGALNARKGAWCDGPKEELFYGKENLDIVAEDLGVIDEGVLRLMKNTGYPGMKVLEFAFDGFPENEHKPSNYTENFVCYTGTHDNMPIAQFIADLTEEQLAIYKEDLLSECEKLDVTPDFSSPETVCASVIELAFLSKAYRTVIPLWDLFAFGGEARFNLPSTVSTANWSFRFINQDFTSGTENRLVRLAKNSNRFRG